MMSKPSKDHKPPAQASQIDWQKQAAENLAGWQRERADFENYRKDIARRETQMATLAARNWVVRLVPVLRDFELALSHAPQNLAAEAQAWLDGALGVAVAFKKILAQEGVKEISPEPGADLDLSKHETVMTEKSKEVHVGKITRVLAKGYALNDLVIAPARVAVATEDK